MSKLTIGVTDIPPWGYVSDGKPLVYRGEMYMLLKDFYEYFTNELNASVTVLPSPDYGIKGEDGEWTGILGKLIRNEVNIMVLPAIPSWDFMQVVDFLSPVCYTYTTILSGVRDSKVEADSRYAVKTFDQTVWALLWIFLIIVCILITLLNSRRQPQSRRFSFIQQCEDNFFSFLGSLCSEGLKRKIEKQRSFLLAFWILAVFVIQGAYLGNLKASVMNLGYDNIDKVEDIAKKPKLRPVVLKDTFFEFIFRRSTLKSYMDVYDLILKHNGALGFMELFSQELMEDISRGRAVQIFDVIQLLFFVSNRKCLKNDYMFSKFPVNWTPIAFMISKNFSLSARKGINKKLQLYSSSMQLQRYLRQLYRKTSVCIADNNSAIHTLQISLQRISLIIFMHLICLAFAIIVLLFEKVSTTDKRKTNEKSDLIQSLLFRSWL